MKLTVRTLQPGDIQFIAANLRPADRAEVIAASGDADMFAVISRAVMRSTAYWVSSAGEPVAIFGVAPLSLLGGRGCPWALATPEAERHPRTLVAEGRRYVQRMLVLYPHLENYVDARNDRSVRWLERVGFRIHPAAPYGVAGLPFHKFDLGT